MCPVGRGVCRAAGGRSGDDYVPVSKCYCYYGYGGEACAQRVVSYVSMLWQVGELGDADGGRADCRVGQNCGFAG